MISTGDVFGTKILHADARYESQAVAHEECWVSVIPREELLDFMAHHSSVAVNFIRLLEGKLADAREDVEALSFRDTESRRLTERNAVGASDFASEVVAV